MQTRIAVSLFLVYILLFFFAIWQYKHIAISIGVILSLISLGGVWYILRYEEKALDYQFSHTLYV